MNDRLAKSELVVLPPIPAKRYFTIGEVSELCGVKPHVLRYWEQEFTQLKPVKRRGNRRYYQHHEVLLIRRIRELLYEQGFTISGARNKLDNRGYDSSAEPDAAVNGARRKRRRRWTVNTSAASCCRSWRCLSTTEAPRTADKVRLAD
jgi:DNA-binding transcriptional MerR regulator